MQPAELAPITVDPIDHAVLLPGTLVVDHGGLGPAEEALAALAGDDPVVDAAGLVAAHLARDDLDLGWKRERERKVKYSTHAIMFFLITKGVSCVRSAALSMLYLPSFERCM